MDRKDRKQKTQRFSILHFLTNSSVSEDAVRDATVVSTPVISVPVKNSEDTERRSRMAMTLQVVAGAASLATVVAALLAYMGWVRDYATDSYFGLNSSVVGYDVTDMMLRSIDSILLPSMALGSFILTFQLARVFGLPPLISRWQHFLVTGIVALVAGVISIALQPFLDVSWITLFSPLSICLGLLLVSHGCRIYDLEMKPKNSNRPGRAAMYSSLALAVFALFWTLSNYAYWYGTNSAQGIQETLTSAPDITVLSEFDLNLSGPGVTVRILTKSADGFHYEYDGLRLLAYSNSRYFLIPEGWRPGNGSVAVLSESSSGPILVEFGE